MNRERAHDDDYDVAVVVVVVIVVIVVIVVVAAAAVAAAVAAVVFAFPGQLSSRDGTNLNGDKPVLDGHYKDELWGLAWNPVKPEYATVGDDATLRIWCATSYKMLRRYVLAMAASMLARGAAVLFSLSFPLFCFEPSWPARF